MTIKYPKGFRMRGHTQVAVRFPDDLFKAIIAMAKKENKDFNAMAIELCKCGKLDLEESDALEPTPVTRKGKSHDTKELDH